jgi:hypothetical protein
MYLSIYLSISLSIYLSTYLPIYLSIYLPTYPSIHLSIRIYPYQSISIHTYLCLSISISLSTVVSLSISISNYYLFPQISQKHQSVLPKYTKISPSASRSQRLDDPLGRWAQCWHSRPCASQRSRQGRMVSEANKNGKLHEVTEHLCLMMFNDA